MTTQARIIEIAEHAICKGVESAVSLYNISEESVKRYIREYRKIEGDETEAPNTTQTTIEVNGNTATLTSKTNEVKTLDDLLRESEVDLDVWNVNSYSTNKWDSLGPNSVKIPMFQVKARLERRVPEEPEWPVIQAVNTPVIHRKESVVRDSQSHLILSDLHVGFNRTGNVLEPYHDRSVMDAVLRLVADVRFDTITLNGDMIDNQILSRFEQRPEFTDTLQPAINELGWFLSRLRELNPYARILYVDGNHGGKRLEARIMENMAWAYGLKAYGDTQPLLTIPRLLGLDNLDIEWQGVYPNSEYWINDNLRVYHGEFVSPQKELASADNSVIFGHVHSSSTLTKTLHTRKGPKTIEVHTSGCMCRIDGIVPGKVSHPNWNQGIITVDTYKQDFNVNHHIIKNGILFYKGKVYEGKHYET